MLPNKAKFCLNIIYLYFQAYILQWCTKRFRNNEVIIANAAYSIGVESISDIYSTIRIVDNINFSKQRYYWECFLRCSSVAPPCEYVFEVRAVIIV